MVTMPALFLDCLIKTAAIGLGKQGNQSLTYNLCVLR